MDFSGFGMTFVSCCFMFLAPPLPAGIAFIVIYGIRRSQGMSLSSTQGTALFAVLYALSFVASCFFIYFFFLRHMYVM